MKIQASFEIDDAVLRADLEQILRDYDSAFWKSEADFDEDGLGEKVMILPNYADKMIDDWFEENFDFGDFRNASSQTRAEMETIADEVYIENQPEISREIIEKNAQEDLIEKDLEMAQ